MMCKQRCAPEGALLDTPENRLRTASYAALEQAMADGAVVEGIAVRCTEERSLIVGLPCGRAVIPRDEGALGLREGKTREVALLSRVGKPVCGVVIGFEDGLPILSRRIAQEAAQKELMQTLRPGMVIPGRVTHTERFGAFVDVGRGLISFLGVESISVSRISHTAQRFAPGQEVFAAVKAVDRAEQRIYLTHRELLGTWTENAERFPAGSAVCGIVRTVEPYGVFIELSPNLSGLAEPREGLTPGMPVSVFVRSVQPARMKLKLSVLECLPETAPATLRREDYFITQGVLSHWRYSPPECVEKLVETWF